MTKKYEKFEEWMLHAYVVTSDGKKGVVSANIRDCVYVYFENGSDWYMLNDVEFLEEVAHEEETSPIPWEAGQVVWDVIYGKGIISSVVEDDLYPVEVEFDDGGNESYTLQGCFYEVGTRTLFFSEPTIIADTMPPKKPFVPKLKEGDRVLIKDKQGLFGEGTVRVVHKECDDRIYISDDEHYFMKYDIASLQVIGEEIKFEEI